MSGKPASPWTLFTALAGNPRILKAGMGTNLFLMRYLRKFRVRRVDGRLVVHSHLPPLNSRAYRRFIDEHLIARVPGPSHAQIGVTAQCPQNCEYCYNRRRSGEEMDTGLILRAIEDLKRMGVFWLGLTGGEPLLNPDLERITRAADGCAVKLFTTGCTLTAERAERLREAGLFSAAVSLDHRDPAVHDRIRRYPGAFSDAMNAIEFLRQAGIHVGVSSVLSGDMLREEEVERFLEFLLDLGIDEAWLSESKPTGLDDGAATAVIEEEQRRRLCALQDRWNRKDGLTVNYLGHFEGREHFGCGAGIQMIYIDAFGEVSPCVFTPMSFGNIRKRPLIEIYGDMRERFAHASECFINSRHDLLRRYAGEDGFLDEDRSRRMMEEVRFSPPGRFFQTRGKPVERHGSGQGEAGEIPLNGKMG